MPLDVFDPGLINIEDQGYPPPLPGSQGLPVNTGDLTDGSRYAPPIVPAGLQALSTPTQNEIASQAALPVSPSLGVAAAAPTAVNVGAQNPVLQPVRDWTVTDSGSFQTNDSNSLLTLTVVSLIDADTFAATTTATTRYRVTVSPASLASLGLSLTGRQVVFSGNTTAAIAGFVRTIQVVGSNVIIIAVTEFGQSFNPNPAAPPVTPQAGDTMVVPTDRDSSQVVFDQGNAPQNVFLNPAPPVAQTTPGVGTTFQGNIAPGSGVLTPFFGSGVVGGRFIGTFQAASQTFGQGLPAEVFQ